MVRFAIFPRNVVRGQTFVECLAKLFQKHFGLRLSLMFVSLIGDLSKLTVARMSFPDVFIGATSASFDTERQ